MTRSVLLRLPDRQVLSEHSNKVACSLCRVRAASNQQRLQTRKRTSERWPHPIFVGSSWFSPLVGELLRVSQRRTPQPYCHGTLDGNQVKFAEITRLLKERQHA